MKLSCRLPSTARAPSRQGFSQRVSRSPQLKVFNKLVLTPTGDGSSEHLDEKVALPSAITLKNGTLDIGRVEPCEVIIPIPTVSSRHAILTIEGDKVLVIDNNSTNGTAVNGKEIKAGEAVEVPVGAEITFGDENLAKFKLEKLPDPPAPQAEVTSDAAPETAAPEATPAAA